MLGAIAGDVIGSVYEFSPIKNTTFPLFQDGSRFTDDTVLTIAVADALLHQKDIIDTLKDYTRRYPDRGYGGSYSRWAFSESRNPYFSWGNGSAMRTSPIALYYEDEEQVLDAAEKFAAVTHDHPHGIAGAQAVSLAIYMARRGIAKKDIRSKVADRFDYDLSRSLSDIRPSYAFDVSCQGSVPQAITAFLESTSVEDAIRKAVSLGGDADTLACISGGIAEAYYGSVPLEIKKKVRGMLPADFLTIIDAFYAKIST